jgi:hypothetical protein
MIARSQYKKHAGAQGNWNRKYDGKERLHQHVYTFFSIPNRSLDLMVSSYLSAASWTRGGSTIPIIDHLAIE